MSDKFSSEPLVNPSNLFGDMAFGSSVDYQELFYALGTVLNRLFPLVGLLIGLTLAFFVGHMIIRLKDGEPIEGLDGLSGVIDGFKNMFSGFGGNPYDKHFSKTRIVDGRKVKIRRSSNTEIFSGKMFNSRPVGYSFVSAMTLNSFRQVRGEKYGINRLRESIGGSIGLPKIKLSSAEKRQFRSYQKRKSVALPKYHGVSLFQKISGKRGGFR